MDALPLESCSKRAATEVCRVATSTVFAKGDTVRLFIVTFVVPAGHYDVVDGYCGRKIAVRIRGFEVIFIGHFRGGQRVIIAVRCNLRRGGRGHVGYGLSVLLWLGGGR